MDALTEKKTNMDNETSPSQQTAPERSASRQPSDDTFGSIDVIDGTRVGNTSSSSTMAASADRDIEKEAEAEAAKPQQAAPPAKQQDPNLIVWDGPTDPGNPMNWSIRKKWITTIAYGCLTFCATFASAVFSTATIDVANLYHVSPEVSTLGTSLFIFGFAVGPP
jgi:DHA1 family multidrug resistance protein-like MFS transporter